MTTALKPSTISSFDQDLISYGQDVYSTLNFDIDKDFENEILSLACQDEDILTTSLPITTTTLKSHQECMSVSPENSDSEDAAPIPSLATKASYAPAPRRVSMTTDTSTELKESFSVPCPLTASPVISSSTPGAAPPATCVSPVQEPAPAAPQVISTITARTFLMPVQQKAAAWTDKTLPRKKSSNIKRRRPISTIASVIVSSSSSDNESTSSSSSSSTTVPPAPKQLLTAQEIFEKRRERNRQNAKKSRMKKRDMTIQLQESLVALKEENEKIRKGLKAAFEAGNFKKRTLSPEEEMIEDLKKPSNRVVDDDTLSFLRSLRNNLPTSISN